jgi:insulysin
MHVYPPEYILIGPHYFEKYDKEEFDNLIMKYFTPENLRIYILSKDYENITHLQVEEYYQTKFKQEEIPKNIIDRLLNPPPADKLIPALNFPLPNPFIPEKFDIKENSEKTEFPRLIRDNKWCKIWHKQDYTFKQPKGIISVKLYTPLAYLDPESALKTQLFGEILKEELNDYSYYAHTAGVNFSIGILTDGIEICVSGYDDKLDQLLYKIFQVALNLEIDEKKFLLIREKKLRSLENFFMDPPHNLASYNNRLLLNCPYFSKTDYINVIKDLTTQQQNLHNKNILRSVFYEALIMGNFTKEEGLTISDRMEKIISRPPPLQQINSRVIQLDHPFSIYKSQCFNPKETNCAIHVYYQIGLDNDTKLLALLQLFAQIVKANCFAQLRTKEQLGYIGNYI